MPGPDHQSDSVDSIGCAVMTVSDSRTLETDVSGDLIANRLESAGHKLIDRRILPDEVEAIRAAASDLCGRPDVEALVVSGGTGLSARDTTFEALDSLYQKRLDGFGELFRSLSYRDIGPAAMLSRASAGTVDTVVVFSLPGSPGAVKSAMDELILPELGHVVHLLRDPRR